MLQLQVSQTGFVTCKSDLVADISENVLRIVTCDYHKSLNENEKKLIMVIFGFSRLLWFESVVLSLFFVIWRIFQNNEQVSELAEVSLQSLISFGKTIDN